MDPAVVQWRRRGQVFVWHYREGTHNYPGWHMTADSEACTSLLELIDLMQAARWPSRKSVAISSPTERVLRVPNNRGGMARCAAPKILMLDYDKDQPDPNHWSLELQGDTLVLMVGPAKLSELRQGIVDIAAGKGDYAIDSADTGDDSDTCLWFWWLPEGRAV